MSQKTKKKYKDGLYFLTFTCAKWLSLFEITKSYDLVYNWFEILKKNGSYICGYVIMPNHVHTIIAFKNTDNKSIDTIVGNGKRFMAYEIISRLEENGNTELLDELSNLVTASDKKKGKLHEVFEPSFDWKECISDEFTETKLNYIHNNPCSGKWNLEKSPQDYNNSSAKYYETGQQGVYEVFNYKDLDDVVFIKE
jgi:REP element-mobilizing transposase RayT